MAAAQWPREGMPESPKVLVALAARRLTDLCVPTRPAGAGRTASPIGPRRRREPGGRVRPRSCETDTLVLLFLCCHPRCGRLADRPDIAGRGRSQRGRDCPRPAHSEQTVTRRITRAKQTIKDSGVPFALPSPGRTPGRSSEGPLPDLQRGYASTWGRPARVADMDGPSGLPGAARHSPRDSEATGLLR